MFYFVSFLVGEYGNFYVLLGRGVLMGLVFRGFGVRWGGLEGVFEFLLVLGFCRRSEVFYVRVLYVRTLSY